MANVDPIPGVNDEATLARRRQIGVWDNPSSMPNVVGSIQYPPIPPGWIPPYTYIPPVNKLDTKTLEKDLRDRKIQIEAEQELLRKELVIVMTALAGFEPPENTPQRSSERIPREEFDDIPF